MFQIKICGITSVADARAARQLGVDAIGLNFYRGSSRYVTPAAAEVIVPDAPPAIGVFVNATAAEINTLAQGLGLQGVQLHGDEPPELLGDIDPSLPIVRARGMGPAGPTEIATDLDRCRRVGREPAALLIDAAVAGHYGGTGRTVNWSALADYRQWLGNVPLVLAGGLTPANVAEAIQTVQPAGVDTASGVERAPGKKDADQMERFVTRARQAFA